MTIHSLTRSDPLARVRLIFQQQLKKFIDAEPPEAEDDPRELYKDRVWELELLYIACPHYLQSDFRENYAKKHMIHIIARRDDILRSFRVFHQDVEFVHYLRQNYPHLYLLAKWETVCLALAEKYEAATLPDGSLPPSPAPPQPPLTPEERRARTERFRARMLGRTRVQAEDHMADTMQRLELTRQFRADLEEQGLDEDEIDTLVEEFRNELALLGDQQSEERTITSPKKPTTFKQL